LESVTVSGPESRPVVAHHSSPDNIFGWMDFEPVYDRAVASAPPGAALVEVGVFMGKSLAYLGLKARESGKNLRVFGVDSWSGSDEFTDNVWLNESPVNEVPGSVLGLCYTNLAGLGLLEDVTLVVSHSVRAAGLFADGSLHMVFLDAAHDEESVAADIAAWLPKVAPGGVLAGHDYRPEDGFPGVKAAVDKVFGDRVIAEGSCWGVRI
jgi:hypothetical protein